MEKFHEHDCDCCSYLGSEKVEDTGFDLYFCEQGGRSPTVIARFGIDGDYCSGLGFVKNAAESIKKSSPTLDSKSSSLKESVKFVSENESSVHIRLLAIATLRAIESGLLEENLEMPNKSKPKIK